MQALPAGQEVERNGLAVEAGHLLGRGEQGQERAVHLDAAVHERFAGLEDQQLLHLGPPLGERRVGAGQRGPADVGGQALDHAADGDRLVEGALGQGHVTDGGAGNQRPGIREPHLGGAGAGTHSSPTGRPWG